MYYYLLLQLTVPVMIDARSNQDNILQYKSKYYYASIMPLKYKNVLMKSNKFLESIIKVGVDRHLQLVALPGSKSYSPTRL